MNPEVGPTLTCSILTEKTRREKTSTIPNIANGILNPVRAPSLLRELRLNPLQKRIAAIAVRLGLRVQIRHRQRAMRQRLVTLPSRRNQFWIASRNGLVRCLAILRLKRAAPK